MMRVLGLCSYPIESAATRFRMAQFVEPLAERGIELDVRPFLDSRAYAELYKPGSTMRKALGLLTPLAARVGDVFRAGRYDAVFVQREAMFFGPEIIEWLVNSVRRVPMILDLDDATYLSYVSPTYGKLGSMFKFFGKTDRMIGRSATVVSGNRSIAEYVEAKGVKTVIVPTVVDTEIFVPVAHETAIPVVGWIGTHSTFPMLERLFPVLEKVAARTPFVLRIVGAGREDVRISGVEVENLKWSLEREVSDFQTIDIGLYPIFGTGAASDEWLVGKSGFKAIQYMSVGIPFVVSPVGVCGEIGVPGETHFSASDDEQWLNALVTLLESPDLRSKMGLAGRQFALREFTVSQQAEKLARIFTEITHP